MTELDPRSLHQFVLPLVLGAGESLSILTNMGFGFAHSYSMLTTESILASADARLNLRCVLGLPSSKISFSEQLRMHTLEAVQASNWEARLVPYFKGEHILIIDNEAAIRSIPGESLATGKVHFLENDSRVEELIRRFELFWEKSSGVELIYKDSNIIQQPSLIFSVFDSSSDFWDRIINDLATEPTRIFNLHARQFEELVAELLSRQGLDVELTPASKDGGRDILAFLNTPVGRHLHLVECKRYAPNRPIAVRLVRELYGVVEAEKATAGIMVTTSRFTDKAVAFINSVKHRMAAKDYYSLVEWLRTASFNKK